jgi:hypothetical protein
MLVRIRGYSFSISEPYEPGVPRVLTPGEAQAMNTLRAENVQDNQRRLVLAAIDALPEGQLLSQQQLDELQAGITQYEGEYQFRERHQPQARLGAIEVEARALAEERADAQIRQADAPMSEASREALVQALMSVPSVQDEARARVLAKSRVLGGMEDL